MSNQPAPHSSRSLLVRLWPWLVVLAVLLFVGFIRVRLLEMPLERDEGEYAYAGQLILQGIPPFELAYNMKLPGTYYAYAAGMALFGQTTAGVHLTLLTVNALTIAFVFLLGRKLFGVTAGLAACASYGLMSTSAAVFGMAAHATHFVVLFAVPGTLLLWRAFQSDNRRLIFFSGLLYGLAFVMKQQGICFCFFGLLVLLWREKRVASSVADSVKRISWYALGATLPFAVVCIYLAGMGVFSQFWFWTFSYAWTYVTRIPLDQGFGTLLDYISRRFEVYVGFSVLAGVGLAVALRNDARNARLIFVMGFLVFSALGVMPGLYFRPHYFVLLLPAFALTVGMAVEFLQQSIPSRRMKAVPVILLAGVMAWDVYIQRRSFFQLPPQLVCRIIYNGHPFIESVSAAKYIREHSSMHARVAVIGSEPQIYFYASRHSATGYIYTYPLMEDQPYAATMQHHMISEIESAKPEYIVMVLYSSSWVYRSSWQLNESSDVEILHWAQKYLDTDYNCVGILACPLDEPEIQLWGDAARNYHGNQQRLEIYQRKPDAN